MMGRARTWWLKYYSHAYSCFQTCISKNSNVLFLRIKINMLFMYTKIPENSLVSALEHNQ